MEAAGLIAKKPGGVKMKKRQEKKMLRQWGASPLPKDVRRVFAVVKLQKLCSRHGGSIENWYAGSVVWLPRTTPERVWQQCMAMQMVMHRCRNEQLYL